MKRYLKLILSIWFTLVIAFISAYNIAYPTVRNMNYILFETDFSPWYETQDFSSDITYTASFADGMSFTTSNSYTDSKALECLAKLRVSNVESGFKDTININNSHIICLSKNGQWEGYTTTDEVYYIMFSEDYNYVTIAYQREEMGYYKVINSNTVKKYFEQ